MHPRLRLSGRLPPDLQPSELSELETRLEGSIDLTESDPTRCGFSYPKADILAAVASEAALTYQPAPLGLEEARRAVARYAGTVPERVAITTSTSEAYGFLLKLLCDPGDRIAAPTPSYPLIPHLAELEGVGTITYDLTYHDRWRLDLDSLRAALDEGCRAVVTVCPNNPTGSLLSSEEAEAVRQMCLEHRVSLLVDRVFAPYSFADPCEKDGLASLTAPHGPLTFLLDGLSKAAGLPQVKAGWISVYGSSALVRRALSSLEWIADAYLSVSTFTQLALPGLLELAPAMQEQIRARLQGNRRLMDVMVRQATGVELLPAAGTWYAVIRFPPPADEERFFLELLEATRVRVLPGYFFGFDHGGYLVVSLLPPGPTLKAGLDRLLGHLTSSR